MTALPRRLALTDRNQTGLILLGACGVAGIAGAGIAANVPLGLGVVVAVIYGLLALTNLPAAVVLWVPLLYLQFVAGVSMLWMPALLVIVVGVIGSPAARGAIADVASRNRRLVLAISLLFVWLLVSVARTQKPEQTWEYVQLWAFAILVFFVVVGAIATRRQARWLILAFSLGTAVSVLLGFAGAPTDVLDPSSPEPGRLSGGAGDPNILAAGLVPAIVLTAALTAGTRNPLARVGLAGLITVMAAGLAATESRGGLIAATVAILAGFVFFNRHRLHLVVLVTMLLAATAGFFATTPGAFERITSFDNSGTGRTDLWRVALRMSGDHPVAGVGLGNFTVYSGDYTRQPGKLTSVDLIVDRAQVAHNVYLQMLAEAGIVGLLLLLAIAGGSVAAAYRAARRFAEAGDRGMETLSRAVVVALLSVLAASTFLSNGSDKPLWLLLALGPALLGVASRELSNGSFARTSRTR